MRKILDNFSHKEILSLTLVNKTWNFVGKSLLKARGNTVAILGRVRKPAERDDDDDDDDDDSSSDSSDSSFDSSVSHRRWTVHGTIRSPCEDLVDFAQVLGGMTTIPFSGLEINVSHENSLSGGCPVIDESVVSLITSKVPVTHFAMRANSPLSSYYQKEYMPCSAFGPFPLILKENAHRIYFNFQFH